MGKRELIEELRELVEDLFERVEALEDEIDFLLESEADEVPFEDDE